MVVKGIAIWLQLFKQIFLNIFRLEFIFYFSFAVGIVALLYRKMDVTKQQLYDLKEKRTGGFWPDVLKATVLGFGGGLIGSLLMVLAGVSLNSIGISYLWLLAVILFLINPRYLCFSYAGGIISISYLLFGFPRIEVPQLMGLVAILHLVESLLILWSGHLGALPVYAYQSQGNVVGGFNLQRFWPIPLVIMMVVPYTATEMLPTGLISMPDWWPLIRSPLADHPNSIYAMLPVVAALGYGDLAVTDTPAGKSRWSAIRLAIYSVLLLILAVIASYLPWVAWLAALFGPLGHELLILMGQQKELRGKPLYQAVARGIMVLDVYPGSIAAKIGLKSGDIVLNVNDYEVNNRIELSHARSINNYYVTMDYLRNEKSERAEGRVAPGEGLGVVWVPQAGDRAQVSFSGPGIGLRWIKKLIGKLNALR